MSSGNTTKRRAAGSQPAPPADHEPRADAYTRRSAYTLVEVILSMALATVLLTGIASALVIASRAMPDADSPATVEIESAMTLDRIAEEMGYAETFPERTATAVTFTVPDRDGDGGAETIAYTWSGTPGDPLTRKYNDGTAATVADNVETFTLEYFTRTESETTTDTVTTETPEEVLASFDGWVGVIPQGFWLGADRWGTQQFTINPPTDVDELEVTRALVRLKTSTTDSSAYVTAGFHTWDSIADAPTSPSIGTPAQVMSSNIGSTFSWTTFTFSDVLIPNPTATSYGIVLKGNVLGAGHVEQHNQQRCKCPNGIMHLFTTDGGATWDPDRNRDDYEMPFYVYGVYRTTTTGEVTVTREYLRTVRLTLRRAGTGSADTVTAVSILNEPQVSGS